MPKYVVTATYKGETESRTYSSGSHHVASEWINELVFTGKRGATITIEMV